MAHVLAHVSNACNAQTVFSVARSLLLVLVALPAPVLSLVLVRSDREEGGCAGFDQHVLSEEAKADVASPRLMPGLSIHMDFFVRSLGPLCTQLWIFVNFSPVCLFSAGRKQRDRQGHTKSQPRTDEIICYQLCFVLVFQPLFEIWMFLERCFAIIY